MPYNRDNIPDAPMPLGMLPSATEFHDNDILILVQPNNPAGQRTRSTTLGALKESRALVEKTLVTSTAPTSGTWNVDLTGCSPYTHIQLIRPAGRADTSVDRVILKNIPADVLMTVEISVDYGVLTGSLLVHLESTSELLGTLRSKFLDSAIGVFKNTTKESFCQLSGTISNEFYDLNVWHKLDVESFGLKPDGAGFKLIKAADVSGTPPTFNAPDDEFDTAAEAMATPAKFYINTYYQEVKFVYDGVSSDNPTSMIVASVYLRPGMGCWLIPIDCIPVGMQQNKYGIRFSVVGGCNAPTP